MIPVHIRLNLVTRRSSLPLSTYFSNPKSDRNSLPPWQPRTARWMVLLLARSSLNLTSAGLAMMLSTTCKEGQGASGVGEGIHTSDHFPASHIKNESEREREKCGVRCGSAFLFTRSCERPPCWISTPDGVQVQ